MLTAAVFAVGCSTAPESDGFEQLQGVWKMLNVVDTPASVNDSVKINYIHYLQIGSDRFMRFGVTDSNFSDDGRMKFRNHNDKYYYFERTVTPVSQLSQPYRVNLITQDTMSLNPYGDMPDLLGSRLLIRQR
ncbi:MAG: hypothetical protein JSS75_06980 [Bacteroidetes bacterium]|nr:hypothetical protein [Bacteroidota bacterium]